MLNDSPQLQDVELGRDVCLSCLLCDAFLNAPRTNSRNRVIRVQFSRQLNRSDEPTIWIGVRAFAVFCGGFPRDCGCYVLLWFWLPYSELAHVKQAVCNQQRNCWSIVSECAIARCSHACHRNRFASHYSSVTVWRAFCVFLRPGRSGIVGELPLVNCCSHVSSRSSGRSVVRSTST